MSTEWLAVFIVGLAGCVGDARDERLTTPPSPPTAIDASDGSDIEAWDVAIDVTAPAQMPATVALVRAGGPRSSWSESPVTVEVAETPQKRRIGLQGRARLAEDFGMLFVYGGAAGPHVMWMKNCALRLDFAFVRADGVVEAIETLGSGVGLLDEDVPRTTWGDPCTFVLSMNAGWFARKGIEPGDVVDASAAIANIEAK